MHTHIVVAFCLSSATVQLLTNSVQRSLPAANSLDASREFAAGRERWIDQLVMLTLGCRVPSFLRQPLLRGPPAKGQWFIPTEGLASLYVYICVHFV